MEHEEANVLPASENNSQRADGHIKSNTGSHQLFCKYWKPAQPKAVVFISHGFGEHGVYYDELAEELFKESFYVFTHDHVGHGRSEGNRAYIDSIDEYVNDVLEHFRKIEEDENLPVVPYFVVGHSMGGTIAIKMAMKKPDMLRGLVLIAPAVVANSDLLSPTKIFFARILSKILPQFPIAPMDYDKCSRNVGKVDVLKSDKLCYHGKVKARWGMAMLDATQEITNNVANIEWPFLLLHGDKDVITDISGSRLLQEASVSKDKTFKVYEGAYHNLLNEHDDVTKSVIAETVRWIVERVDRGPDCNLTTCVTEVIADTSSDPKKEEDMAAAAAAEHDEDMAEKLEIMKISEEAVVEIKLMEENGVGDGDADADGDNDDSSKDVAAEIPKSKDVTELTPVPEEPFSNGDSAIIAASNETVEEKEEVHIKEEEVHTKEVHIEEVHAKEVHTEEVVVSTGETIVNDNHD